MGFLTPTLRKRVMDASLSIPEHVMKELFKNAMCLPHVLTVLVAALISLEDVFESVVESTTSPAGSGRRGEGE